jgi:hypothetical protein
MAGDIQLPAGTTVQATIGTGTATAVSNLKSIGSNEAARAMADVTGLSDTAIKRKPARKDPGTVEFVIYVDNTAPATNSYTTWTAARDAGSKTTLAVNLPDSFDDSTPLFSYTGYVASVTTPEIAAGDDALTFSVNLQVSGY